MSVLVLCDVCFGPHAVAPEQLGSVVKCRYCRASFIADESVQLEMENSGMTLPEFTRYSLSVGKRIGSMILSVAAVVLMLFLCTVSPRSAAERVIASMPARNNPPARTNSGRPPVPSQRPPIPSHFTQQPFGPHYPPPSAHQRPHMAISSNRPGHSQKRPDSHEQLHPRMSNTRQDANAHQNVLWHRSPPIPGGFTLPPHSPYAATNHTPFETSPFPAGSPHHPVPQPPIPQLQIRHPLIPHRQIPQPPTSSSGVRF